MDIDKKEVRRYLGYGGAEADETVTALIEECINELTNVVTPRCVYKQYDLVLNSHIEFAGMIVNSKNLNKNLEQCSKIVLFAATLGVQADFLLKKYSKTQMSKAVVLQACAAAYIEAYCDECQFGIELEMQALGYYLRPRFSPGYGDFGIHHQLDIINVLECPKKIGLTLTDSFILAPSKSVTAIIGLSKEPQNCHKKGCEECEKVNCQFRRS